MDPYGDEQLVELYDLDNPDGDDHAYYRALADSLDARKILDLGCGTGLLTRSFARPGREVIGIDPSRTMLDYARRTPSPVTWTCGDHHAIEPTGDVDLVVCTGNTLMHIADLGTALTAIAAALRPGGVFAFESRNPSARAWESWTREATYGERDTPIGHLTEWLDLIEVAPDGRVVFDAHNVFPNGSDRIYRNTLYFRSADALTTALGQAGFTATVDADWHGTPLHRSRPPDRRPRPPLS
ncbi:class I SAM-dependent methyltransferase [Kribbella sp. NPDC026611]|uniref:class I SAM-dependent methyltransferase n=1 Tax=Kribbella sp. NPDC026611 TaxID=3154911 RepID=UPI0033D839B9